MEKVKNFIRNVYDFSLRTARWIARHQYIIILFVTGVFAVTCCTAHRYMRKAEAEIIALNDSIKSITVSRDSLECLYRVDDIMRMAGEFAVKPHSDRSDITQDTVAGLLKKLDAWFPDIKMAQYQCESGFGKSEMAKGSNNMGGMRKTQKRQTTQIKGDEYHGYGKYNNWESSVIDHVLWDYAIFGCKKPTRPEYIATLDRIYGGYGDYGQVMDRESRKYRKYFKQD